MGYLFSSYSTNYIEGCCALVSPCEHAKTIIVHVSQVRLYLSGQIHAEKVTYGPKSIQECDSLRPIFGRGDVGDVTVGGQEKQGTATREICKNEGRFRLKWLTLKTQR